MDIGHRGGWKGRGPSRPLRHIPRKDVQRGTYVECMPCLVIHPNIWRLPLFRRSGQPGKRKILLDAASRSRLCPSRGQSVPWSTVHIVLLPDKRLGMDEIHLVGASLT